MEMEMEMEMEMKENVNKKQVSHSNDLILAERSLSNQIPNHKKHNKIKAYSLKKNKIKAYSLKKMSHTHEYHNTNHKP